MMRNKMTSSSPWQFVPTHPLTLLILTCSLFFQNGCSSFNCNRLETLLDKDTNLIELSYTIADHLAERAFPPLVPHHPDMPLLVTTFVDNNDLQQTSQFGRVLQEHIASRFVQRGYTVREIKFTDTLNVEPRSGETILSRNLTELSKGMEAQAILAGTISRTNRVLYISARLINPVNSNIVASDDYKLYMDDTILTMYGFQQGDAIDQPIAEPQQPFLNSIL